MRPERTPFVAAHLRDGAVFVASEGLALDQARMKHLAVAMSFVPTRLLARSALHLEFGVRDGRSLRALANMTREGTKWDGFDSWHGLPTASGGRGAALTSRQRVGWGTGKYSTRIPRS